MQLLMIAFFSALLFGLGLGISGMTLPSKVIGFLDIGGNWDPSLAFVMVGAIAIHALSYRFILRRRQPVMAADFQIPTSRVIDRKLISGSLLFGMGWGLGGFCPGPAIVAVVSQESAVVYFLLSMFAGIYLYKWTKRFIT